MVKKHSAVSKFSISGDGIVAIMFGSITNECFRSYRMDDILRNGGGITINKINYIVRILRELGGEFETL